MEKKYFFAQRDFKCKTFSAAKAFRLLFVGDIENFNKNCDEKGNKVQQLTKLQLNFAAMASRLLN